MNTMNGMRKAPDSYARDNDFPVINRKRRGRRHEALCYSLLKSDTYTLAIPTVTNSFSIQNLTKEELVGYLRTELLKIDNEINALFLKRQKIMDTLVDFEKKIKEEIKENVPVSNSIKFKKYSEELKLSTHRGVLDLARQNFEDVDFGIFKMADSDDELMSEDELDFEGKSKTKVDQPSSTTNLNSHRIDEEIEKKVENQKPNSMEVETEGSKSKGKKRKVKRLPLQSQHENSSDKNISLQEMSVEKTLQKNNGNHDFSCEIQQTQLEPDMQCKQLYVTNDGNQFVPNYVAMGIPYAVIKEFVEEKGHDDKLCKRLAREFGLNPESANLEDHLKEMFHFLVENKVADPLLYAIRDDCKHLYKDCTVQDFMISFN